MNPGQLPVTPSLVLRRWKVVYVVTPKAACTSMMWTIAELQQERLAGVTSSLSSQVTRMMTVHDPSQWCHTPMLQQLPASELLNIEKSGDWFIFCISRHPVNRLWSAWQSKLLMREPCYISRYSGASWFPRVPAEPENIPEDFELFVDALEEDPALRIADQHWQQQCELLQVGKFPYTHVGRVEALAETLQALEEHLRRQGSQGTLPEARHNVSLLPLNAGLLGEKTARRIEELYVDDMTVFGYPPAGSTRTLGHADAEEATGKLAAVAPIALQAIREIIARNERIGDLQRVALSIQSRERAAASHQPKRPTALGPTAAPPPSTAPPPAIRPQYGHIGPATVSIVLLTASARPLADELPALELPDEVELVVIQPASAREEVRGRRGEHVLQAHPAASIAAKFQMGCEAASGDIIVLCRDITAISRDWLSPFREALSHPETGMVSAILEPHDAPGVLACGLVFIDEALNCRWLTRQRVDHPLRVPLLAIRFAALKAEVLRSAGGLDTAMTGNSCHDLELSVRLWRLGHECLVLPQVRATWQRPVEEDAPCRRTFLFNLLRMAAIHLDPQRLAVLLGPLQSDPLLPDVLAEVVLSGVGARRAFVEAATLHDFTWFRERFPL